MDYKLKLPDTTRIFISLHKKIHGYLNEQYLPFSLTSSELGPHLTLTEISGFFLLHCFAIVKIYNRLRQFTPQTDNFVLIIPSIKDY